MRIYMKSEGFNLSRDRINEGNMYRKPPGYSIISIAKDPMNKDKEGKDGKDSVPRAR